MKQILLLVGVLIGTTSAIAQCPIGSSYLSGDAPLPGSSITITTCAYGGEYQTINNVVDGQEYEITYSDAGGDDFITVFDASQTAVASGPSPLTFVAASGSGTYYSVGYDDNTCATDFDCHSATWEAIAACPAVTMLTMTGGDATSADVSWTAGGSEVSWNIEWGAPGFTPGTGAELGSDVSATSTYNVTGLNSNETFDLYVQSDCGSAQGLWELVTVNTYNMPAYMQTTTDCPTGGFMDISATGTELALGDDTELPATIPFDFYYQGDVYSSVIVNNNGRIHIGNISGTNTASVWSDDLDTETGSVIYETMGTAPNRIFIVQFEERCNFSGSAGAPNVTFQAQFYETTGEIYYVYEDVIFGGTNANDDYGNNATIGLNGPVQSFTQSTWGDNTYLTNNTCAKYSYTDCPTASGFLASGITTNEGTISWTAGLAGETEWTVIYGEEGFDPTSAGTTVGSLTNPTLTIPSLDDLTTYDVYIYSDCNPGTLQSDAYMGSFTTLPNCSDPTGLSATGLVDSIDVVWNFTESTPAFPSTGFNLQYGTTGFDLYSGTVVMADNDFTDTIIDNTLFPGTIYDIYVQAECGSDTSNYVGPFTFTSPLTNDSTCFAVPLMVDGTVYTLSNVGATVGANEASIAPPVTGYGNNTGWGEGTVYSSTWFTFDAPASGRIKISGRDVGALSKSAVYEVSDCGDLATFTLVGANHENEYGNYTGATEYTLCGLTPGNTYYLMHAQGFSWSGQGEYSLRLEEPAYEAGASNGMLEICAGESIDLETGVTGNEAGGVWTEEIPTAGFSGSTFNSAGLAYQTYNFEYRIQEGCYYDSVVQQVQVYGPSSAGTDGSLTVCKNESINLVAALTGNVDLGGTWYDSQDAALTSGQIMSPSLPGQYNYTYITGNGVCADDTANVVLSVDPNCDWLSIDEQSLENLSVYPNPTQGSVYVSNVNSTEVFNIMVTDLKGSVVVEMDNALNGTEATEVSLENLESGIYMIKVYNDNASTIFRIVKD